VYLYLQESQSIPDNPDSNEDDGGNSDRNSPSQLSKVKDVSHLKARLEKIKMMAKS